MKSYITRLCLVSILTTINGSDSGVYEIASGRKTEISQRFYCEDLLVETRIKIWRVDRPQHGVFTLGQRTRGPQVSVKPQSIAAPPLTSAPCWLERIVYYSSLPRQQLTE